MLLAAAWWLDSCQCRSDRCAAPGITLTMSPGDRDRSKNLHAISPHANNVEAVRPVDRGWAQVQERTPAVFRNAPEPLEAFPVRVVVESQHYLTHRNHAEPASSAAPTP